jgi:HK97 family phage major capsid protein
MSASTLAADKAEYDRLTAAEDAIADKARIEKRDVSDAEQAEIDTLHARQDELQPRIEAEHKRQQQRDAVAAIYVKTGMAKPAEPVTDEHKRSTEIDPAKATTLDMAQALTAAWSSRHAENAHVRTEAQSWLDEHLRVDTQTTTDNPGILPVPILGPLMKFVDARRPVLSSFTQRPHPGTKTWTRPRLVQGVSVDVQATELAEVASQNFTTDTDTVTSGTYAGVLKISEQDIDWTDPSALQILLDDFRDRYAIRTETVASTQLATLASVSATTEYDDTSYATILASLNGAVDDFYAASDLEPTTLWIARDIFSDLAGRTTGSLEEPLLVKLLDALARRGTPLRLVTGNKLAAGKMIMGYSPYVEAWERDKGFVQGIDVSHLGIDIAYRGYYVTYAATKALMTIAPAA